MCGMRSGYNCLILVPCLLVVHLLLKYFRYSTVLHQSPGHLPPIGPDTLYIIDTPLHLLQYILINIRHL